MPNVTLSILIFTLFVLLAETFAAEQQQTLKQQTIIDIKQVALLSRNSTSVTIISALNHLTVFSFNSRFKLSSPTDLNGKRIVITNPSSLGTDVYDAESELIARKKSLTETTFKSQLEMYNKMNPTKTITPQSITKYDTIFQDCVFGNPLDNFDVFVMSSEDFIQSFVIGVPKQMNVGGLYEWEDFTFLTEFQVPLSVNVYYNGTSSVLESLVESQVRAHYDYMNGLNFSNSSVSTFELMRNFGYMFYRNGFGNISSYGKDFLSYYLEQYNDIPLKNKPQVQFYAFSSEKYVKEYETLSWRYFNQTTSMMPINDMYCYEKYNNAFTVCSGMMKTSNIIYDTVNLVTIVIGVLFYVALLTVYNTKPIKRRLTAPYILPALVIFCNICFSTYANMCRSVKSAFIICLIAAIIGVYGFTLLRFTYLRYLYLFLSKTQGKIAIKLHKILVSSLFGIFGSLIFGFAYAMVWMLVCVPYITLQLFTTDAQIVMNIMYVVEVISGTVLGTVIILVDIVLNWKKIKDKGLYTFLTFEDPFGLRLDVLYFVCIFLSTTTITIISPFNFGYRDVVVGVLKGVAFFFTYMLGGGTAILIEWKRIVKGFFSKKRNNLDSDKKEETIRFEELMKDSLFKSLFETYCSKEFSLENALLYEEIQELKLVHEQDDLMEYNSYKRLFETYFQSLSKYEVNLPSHIKKQLVSIYESQHSVNFSKVYEMVRTELLLNLNDTFERLKETSEFKRYSFSRDIQLKNSIV